VSTDGFRPLTVVLRASDWDRLQTHLRHDITVEQHAFLFAGLARGRNGDRLLVREVVPTPTEGFERQSGAYLKLRKEYHQAALVHCDDEGLSLIEVHSHPFGDAVGFSGVDRRNDHLKFPYVSERIPGIRHATMVCSPTGAVYAHTWDTMVRDFRRVEEILIAGAHLRRIKPDGASPRVGVAPHGGEDRYSRQILALGPAGQRALAAARVGVVGLGGNGAPLVQTLAHMGIRRFVLVDPDTLETSNLNRVVGATEADLGVPKVEVAARLVRKLHTDAEVEEHPVSVFAPEAAEALKCTDMLAGATDSVSSRLALSVLSARYLIPYVDMGLRLEGKDGALAACFGQVRVTHPDGPCLVCMGGIDVTAAQAELATPEEQAMSRAAGYGTGMTGPVPSLAPVNGVIANLAALHILAILTGAFAPLPYWQADLVAPRLQAFDLAKEDRCALCSPDGEAAMGDLLPWPRFGSSHLPTNVPDFMVGDTIEGAPKA
jgi:molybdopterin/thiamine biosynthesis adenylyltransferase